jgi:hypothetical protein
VRFRALLAMDIDHCFWFVVFLFVATSKTTDQFFKAITNSKAPNGLVLTDGFIIS